MSEPRVDISSGAVTRALPCLLTLCGLAVLAYDATWPVRAAAAAVTIYILLSLVLHPRQSLLRDPFAIHNISRIMILGGFVFSCLFVSTASDHADEPRILLTLAIGLATVMLGDLGVLLLPRAPDPTTAETERGSDFETRLFLLLFLAGWAWRAYAFTHGLMQGTFIGTKLESTGSSNALGALNGVAATGMWGCVIFAPRPRRYALLVVLEALWLMATGSKGGLLYIVVPFLMILFHRERLRVDTRLLAGMSLVLGVFMMAFVLVQGYRIAVVKQVAESGYENLDAVGAISDIEVRPEDFRLVGESLSERLNLAERFLMIVERQDQRPQPIWRGESYLTALLWAVPRSIWPDKPSMSLGRWFATEYLGWGEESRSEAGVTVWGEAFLNFRLAGALIIPGLWLIALQFGYDIARRCGRWGLLFLASGYLLMMNSLSANIALPIAGLGQVFVLVLVCRTVVATADAVLRQCRKKLHG